MKTKDLTFAKFYKLLMKPHNNNQLHDKKMLEFPCKNERI